MQLSSLPGSSRRAVPRAALLALALALAGLSEANAQVTCSTTVSALNFGVYDVLARQASASNGSVLLRCANAGASEQKIAFSVALSAGNARSFSGPRQARSGNDTLHYQLFTALNTREPWGDGTAGSRAATASLVLGPRAEQTSTLTVFGIMPAQQDVPPGIYTDQILVTVTW